MACPTGPLADYMDEDGPDSSQEEGSDAAGVATAAGEEEEEEGGDPPSFCTGVRAAPSGCSVLVVLQSPLSKAAEVARLPPSASARLKLLLCLQCCTDRDNGLARMCGTCRAPV